VRKAWDESTLMGSIADTYQIKPLALYLASDASSYVTGSPILIDGGMALGKLA
jgi:NAD(P)-dependent dehydrogenase (short-subunit alcohol dehydrogenase family)